MKTPSILIVDDEPDNFDVIETILSTQGYTLNYAANGRDAIDRLDTFNPDLVLLDVMMPGMDGIQVCRKIKDISKWQGLPIIMVTALNTKEDLSLCLQAGADDFISKPVNALELRARVHSMLRIKQQYDRICDFTKLQRNTINLLGNNLQELQGNLALSIPHELNTPLNGILGSLSFLIQDLDDMDGAEIRELLEVSYKSACRLETLTRRFLNLLSLEFDTISFNEKNAFLMAEESDDQLIPNPRLESVDGSSRTQSDSPKSSSVFIAHIAKTIAENRKRSQDLTCELETIDLAVTEHHLQWIASELIDNAFKFSNPETPIVISGTAKDGMFYLSINDRGRGMTQEQIGSIGTFMQFERRTYAQQGTGLGLKIAQKAVELYAGRLNLSSIYHKETTVKIELPTWHE
jgi:CheY-like chemotaxis protein/two-component sensor histidine kinase